MVCGPRLAILFLPRDDGLQDLFVKINRVRVCIFPTDASMYLLIDFAGFADISWFPRETAVNTAVKFVNPIRIFEGIFHVQISKCNAHRSLKMKSLIEGNVKVRICQSGDTLNID